MNNKIIYVELKNVYGRETIYPVCENAKIFVDLISQKTFTRADIFYIKALGYTVNVTQQESTL